MSDRPRPDRRRVLVFVFALVAALTMGGVVALALHLREEGPDVSGSAARGGMDPYSPRRLEPVFPAGCEPDFDRPPKCVFDLPGGFLDFGPMRQGDSREAEVTYRNDGRGPLCVRKVDVACGCVKASFVGDQRRFEPGESGRLKVVMSTRDFEGAIHKRVSLYTNDPSSPIQTFDVKVQITLGLIVSQGSVNFGAVMKGATAKGVIHLKSTKDATDWTVTQVVGTRPLKGKHLEYSFALQEVPDPNQRIVALTILHPGLDEIGTFDDQIKIVTTHPDRPEVSIRGFLEASPPIRMNPLRAVFGHVPRRDRRPVRIRFMPSGDLVRFRVTGTRWETAGGDPPPASGPGFTAEAREGQAGEWEVELQWDAKPRDPGPFEAVLVVTTDHPEAPEFRIPVYATVPQPPR